MTEELTYSRRNSVTHTIEPVSHNCHWAVRKVLNGVNQSDTPPEWKASNQPRHWNYWQRESLVYQSNLQDALEGSGVRLTKLLQDQLITLYENRSTLYSIVESSTRIPSHSDFWPNNVFVDTAGDLVPIDWAFYGEGAFGEDIANFVPDAVFDDFTTPDRLPQLEQDLFKAYLEGLSAGGVCWSANSSRLPLGYRLENRLC